ILTSSVSGEDVSPSVSCMIQNRLGVKCMAMEIHAACSAFLFLLETAAAYFKLGYRKILVVGAERLSRIVDWTDRSTAVIFGDGAGAAVLEAGDNYLASVFNVEGGDSVIKIPHGPGNSPWFDYGGNLPHPYIHMNGQDTFKYAVNAICRDIKTLLERTGKTLEDIACIIPHQANARIIAFAANRLKLPLDKFVSNIENYGNTSSASIPIALHEAIKSGRAKPGDLVLFTAFGGGLASAACMVRL
nr:beta-ketoacyl-ACP synthase 3 [Clostridia bacterium]